MPILVFQHHPHENPARLGAILNDQGHRLRIIECFEGQPIPHDLDDVDGLIIMGGPMNVADTDAHPYLTDEMNLIKQAHQAKLPILGICLGAQLIACALGGQVQAMDQPEVGFAPIQLTFPGTTDPLHIGIPWTSSQFHLHGQHVSQLPPDAVALASSKACQIQAFKVGQTTYAFQYHFEWTREDLNIALADNADWLAQHGLSLETIRQNFDESVAGYLHLGDRLCNTLASILFPIDRRMKHTIRPVANYHAS